MNTCHAINKLNHHGYNFNTNITRNWHQQTSAGSVVPGLLYTFRFTLEYYQDAVKGVNSHSKGAYRALCARCAKSWLFSTTGSSVSSED